MPSKFRLRYIFKPVVNYLAKILSNIGISPNLATFIMLINSFLSFLFLVLLKNLFLFSIFVFLTGLFDGIDGAIARMTNKESRFGGFFDSFMDRISELIIFLALSIYFWNFMLWGFIDMKIIIFISLFASFMISYARARAQTLIEGDFDIGLMARSERLFFIFLTMLISFFIGYEEYFLLIFMILVILTAIFRGVKIIGFFKSD